MIKPFEIVVVDRDDIPEPGTGSGKWEPIRFAICQLTVGAAALRVTLPNGHEADKARSVASNINRDRLKKTGANRVYTRKKLQDSSNPDGPCDLWIWLEA